MQTLRISRYVTAAMLALMMPRALWADPYQLFVEFFDPDGNRIVGPVQVRLYEKSAVGLSFLLEWIGAVDPVTGLRTGAARPTRLEITVPVGPQTPRLAALHVAGKALKSVVFHFVVADARGVLTEFYTIVIEDVHVTRHSLRLPDRLDAASSQRDDEETLGLVYQGLEQGGIRVEQLQYLPGDTTGDLKVDIADTILLLRYLFLGARVSCPLSGDINADRQLDISDAVAELLFLFGGGRPPPTPFPRCGVRPADVPIPCDRSACDAGA